MWDFLGGTCVVNFQIANIQRVMIDIIVLCKISNVFFLPAKIWPQKDTLQRIGDRAANAIYVNGIISPISQSLYQNNIIENLFNRPVELLYNPSNGFFVDIYECVVDRSIHYNSPVAVFASKVIEEKLKAHHKVLLIGYSQGSIILSSALQILKSRLPITDLLRINFVSFAPGFLDYDIPHVYSEHFCNTKDPVVKIGALYNRKKLKAKYLHVMVLFIYW
jgi:hypothetical protein